MMKMRNLYLMIALLTAAPLVLSGSNDKGDDILEKLIENHKKQREGITEMKIIKDDAVSYEKWEEKDGKTVYKWREERNVNGQKQISVFDGETYYTRNPMTGQVEKTEDKNINPLHFYQSLQNLDCEYQGEVDVDGVKCHVLVAENVPMEDVAGITNASGSDEENEQMDMQDAEVDVHLYVDDKRWVIPKMVLETEDMGQGDAGGMFSKARIEVKNSDFRKVSGMFIAYQTVSSTSFKKTPEGKKKSDEMKKAMNNMSPEEREMMEERMGEASGMLEDEGMQTETRIEKVEINEGFSDDLFDGDNL
ncbi:MAG: LolA family protein [Bacteroidales bacterium]